ncbi:MAG: hypothetical protein ABI142_03725, partial [Bryocella sp.]
MLDLNYVRANLALVEEKLRTRGADTAPLADFASLDAERRSAITELGEFQTEINVISTAVGNAKRHNEDTIPNEKLKRIIVQLGEEGKINHLALALYEAFSGQVIRIDAAQQAGKHFRDKIQELQQKADSLDDKLRNLLQNLPNLPQDSVPAGKSELDNICEKTWGTPPTFNFTPKPHWELGVDLGILDFDRAAKISGSRFVVHFGSGARLERALANFML